MFWFMRGSEHLEDTKSIIHLLLDKERPSKQEQRNAANQDSATSFQIWFLIALVVYFKIQWPFESGIQCTQ